LGTSFRHLNFKLAMRYELSNYVSAVNFLHSNFLFCIFSSVLASKIDYSNHEPSDYDNNSTSKLLGDMLSPHDMKRLEAYSNNLVDYHLVRNTIIQSRR
jgi:N-acetyltransferase 10